MDISLCRQHLTQLLDEEAQALKCLEGLLEKEHSHIVSDDIEALDQAGSEREACVQQLLRIDSERQSLCRAVGLPADKVGLMQLLSRCDAKGTLQARWSASTASIRHCRMLNDRNGALVNNRLARVGGMLQQLNGGTQSKVYTARGNAYVQPQAGRMYNAQV